MRLKKVNILKNIKLGRENEEMWLGIEIVVAGLPPLATLCKIWNIYCQNNHGNLLDNGLLVKLIYQLYADIYVN